MNIRSVIKVKLSILSVKSTKMLLRLSDPKLATITNLTALMNESDKSMKKKLKAILERGDNFLV